MVGRAGADLQLSLAVPGVRRRLAGHRRCHWSDLRDPAGRSRHRDPGQRDRHEQRSQRRADLRGHGANQEPTRDPARATHRVTAAVAPPLGSGAQQVELSWSPVASNGGLQIRDYVIQRFDDGRTWSTVADGVSATPRRGVPARQRHPLTGSASPPSTAPARALERHGPSHTEMDPGRTRRPAAAVAPVPTSVPRTGHAHLERGRCPTWSTDHRLRGPTLPGRQNLDDRATTGSRSSAAPSCPA